ncbi:GNAT family N-acetyltransferase [Paeniglutamicibacter antarcticus]|uniref:GNAT family N-acetyltransferase n=1 Tax=Arthrobacter terrae TaxID=2935737 RepID=A0A931CM35_9MICC|nr:GNAT family N-acetyltransferase [Arthrobacter terrae]MBG0738396.1 GNAT family N-acetyltransferase [Arthrobacter terrae]
MPDVTLTLPRGTAILRRATAADLPVVIELLADDPISRARDDAGDSGELPALENAFAAIDSDPAQQLLVVAGPSADIVATMQLTVIPGLARAGASRLQIEGVRVRTDMRGQGIGGAMIRWAVDAAPALGAGLVQLTSDAVRVDAHRFYERLGFTASHIGFKHSVATDF